MASHRGAGLQNQDHQVWLPSIPTVHKLNYDYYICDMITSMTSSLPVYPDSDTLEPNSMGMIRCSDRLMVVELQTNDRNKLYRYSIFTG